MVIGSIYHFIGFYRPYMTCWSHCVTSHERVGQYSWRNRRLGIGDKLSSQGSETISNLIIESFSSCSRAFLKQRLNYPAVIRRTQKKRGWYVEGTEANFMREGPLVLSPHLMTFGVQTTDCSDGPFSVLPSLSCVGQLTVTDAFPSC